MNSTEVIGAIGQNLSLIDLLDPVEKRAAILSLESLQERIKSLQDTVEDTSPPTMIFDDH